MRRLSVLKGVLLAPLAIAALGTKAKSEPQGVILDGCTIYGGTITVAAKSRVTNCTIFPGVQLTREQAQRLATIKDWGD